MRAVFLCILLFCSTALAQDATELRGYVTKLTETPRISGSIECEQAANYLKKELEIYPVELQGFTYRGQKAYNVLATKNSVLKTVIVVGAHYDSVSNCPGADDNASGTAAVIGLAKRLNKTTTRHIISFQLYAGEEQGLVGSAFYVKHPKYPIKDHIFMVNLDMIGYLKTPIQAVSEPNLDELLRPLYAKYPFAKSITLRGADSSDQDSFKNAGIPAIFLHTGLHKNYHKSTDTADKLNYDGMEAICNYAYDLILAIDKYDIPDYIFLQQLPIVEIPR